MIPIVMSGGSGTRLWPVSRKNFPKQFCEIFDQSLQEKTLRRLSSFTSSTGERQKPWVLTVEDLKVLTELTMKNLSLPKDHVIYEPMARNTAAAIALACKMFLQKGLANEVIGIFPADHLVEKEDDFIRVVNLANECAEKDQIVTIGIKPSYPATGYGYIESKSDIFLSSDKESAYICKKFCEKPDGKTAENFLQSGNFYWNAGMFVFKVEKMIEEFKNHQPKMWNEIDGLNDDLSNITEIYQNLEKISIDYAIMEKTSQLICIPCDIGWSDVGSWEEVAKQSMRISNKKADKKNNNIVEINSENNFIYEKRNKAYGLIGVKDLLVIDNDDALLIAKKGSSEAVKIVVEQLKERSLKQAEEHTYDHRPWGKYEILRDEKEFKSKKITVLAGERISYQSHKQRSEHWIIVSGRGEVTLNDEITPVTAGKHIFIPQGAKHRISALDEDLVFIEVQLGEYFGEDDITRYQDDYFRK